MPSEDKKSAAKGRPRAPKGKKQFLVIIDDQVIRATKLAALEDDRKASHIVEEAVREWLERRKTRKPRNGVRS